MADKSLKFDIIAEAGKAIDELEKVADAAEKLEGEKVEVEVGIDAGQTRAVVQDVLDDLDKIAKTDATAQVKIKVDDAALAGAQKRIKGATDDIKQSTIQSVGPLRDVSSAFGNVGVGALDAAEGVLGFGESLATVNPKFEKFFEVAGKSAFIGGGLALGVVAAAGALADLTGATEAVAKALERMQATDAAESVKEFGKALASSAIQNGLRLIGKGAVDIENFNDVLKESPAAAAHLITALKQAGQDTDELSRLYANHAEAAALAAVANQQFADDVSTYTRAAELGLVTTGKTVEQVELEVAALERSNEAKVAQAERTRDAAAAQDEYREKTKGSADATDDLRDAMEQLNDKIAGQKDAILDAAETRVALADAQKAYNDLVDDEKASVDERVVGAQRVAEKFADVMGAMAEANGESFDRDGAIKASLQETARQASGPTKAAIEDVVEALDDVPEEINTDLNVSNAQALAKINEVRRANAILTAELETMRYLAANPGRPAALPPGVSGFSAAPVHITVNAGFGTDAFAVRNAVTNAGRQAARLARGANRNG